jgi:hypothetical protein
MDQQNPFLSFLAQYAPNLMGAFQSYMQNMQQPPGGGGFAPQGYSQVAPSMGPPGGMYGGGQTTPYGYQQGPSQSPYPYGYPASPPGSQYGPSNNAFNLAFRPTIVQNQYNSIPLRNIGGINATMNASTNLNVNGINPYALRLGT